MRRGQVTVEFVLIAGFLLFLFASLFFVLQNRMVDLRQQKNVETMGQVANIVAVEVRLAAQVGEGYKRGFRLPTQLNGNNYSMSIEDEVDLRVRYEDLSYLKFLEVPVQGNLDKGKNTITCCNGSKVVIS